MEERIRRLVLSQPIPVRLSRALIAASQATEYRTPDRIFRARQWGAFELDPSRLPPQLRKVLLGVCRGDSNAEIGAATNYSCHSVKDQIRALLAVFEARNRAHLAALGVLALVEGTVPLEQEEGEG